MAGATNSDQASEGTDTNGKRSKQGLMKLAVCAGIIWDMSQTKRTDNRRSRDYVSYSAVGAVGRADGTMVPFPAEYDEEKLRNQYEKKGKSVNKSGDELQCYIDYCVKRDILLTRLIQARKEE